MDPRRAAGPGSTARRAVRARGVAALVLSLAALPFTLLAPAAGAAPPASGGLLQLASPADCITQATTGCGTTKAAGLGGATGVAVAPDGANVYVASRTGPAVAAFSRAAGGRLAEIGCTGPAAGCAPTAKGLDGASGVAISPDGKGVYVAAADAGALTAFVRGAGGALGAPVSCASATSVCTTSFVAGLRGARGVAVSPDSRSVYVASSVSDAVAVFLRTDTGGLVPLGCVSEGTPDLDLKCSDTGGRGLDGASGVAVSADGRFVYVAARDGDAVATFARDGATGALAQVGAPVSGPALDGASALAIAPGGRRVYVAAEAGDAVTWLDRDPATGALSVAGSTAGRGLAAPASLVVSPDGRTVLTASPATSSVAVFAADATTGALQQFAPPNGCVEPAGGVAGCVRTGTGLAGVAGVAVSPDGAHVYSAAAGAGAIAAFALDVAAPAAPAVLAVVGGEGWRTVNGFRVTWTNPPGQVAPIVQANYRLCSVSQPGACIEPSQRGTGISALNIGVPGEGEWTLSVWLQDSLGNTDRARSAGPVTLRFDATAPEPPAALDTEAVGWRNRNAFGITWENPPDQAAPIARALYDVCPADGGPCTPGSRSLPGVSGLPALAVPGEGAWTVKVWLEDAAGNVDPAQTAELPADRPLRFDATAPAPPLDLRPTASTDWGTTNDFGATWTNPGGQLAPLERVRYRICEAASPATCPVSGTADDLTALRGLRVPEQGDWRLQVWLEDAAGNQTVANAAPAVPLRYGSGPASAIPPTISGRVPELTCGPGTWTGVPVPALSYEWLRDGEPLAGATGRTYTALETDVGHELQCRETARNPLGEGTVASATLVVPPLPPPEEAPPTARLSPPVGSNIPRGNPDVRGSAAFASGTANALYLACTSRQLAVVDVVRAGARVKVTGVARRRLAGRSAVIEAGGRRLGSARIAANGAFEALVAGPAAGRRRTVTYRARAGGSRSASVALSRRVLIGRTAVAGARIEVSGRVSGALAGRPAPVSILRRTSCSHSVVAATVTPDRRGRFAARLKLPPSPVVAGLYVARTRVARTAGGPAAARSSSLPVAVPVRFAA